METNVFIGLGVVTMFLAVLIGKFIKNGTVRNYKQGAIGGFVIFLLAIFMPDSMASDISLLIAMFMMVFSLPKLILLHYYRI